MPKADKPHFADPIAVKPDAKNKPENKWFFNKRPYDERTSCFMNAGENYGVGHRQPVGRAGNPKSSAATLPFGRPKTMETDEIA